MVKNLILNIFNIIIKLENNKLSETKQEQKQTMGYGCSR
jgi:hypothetical protein